MNKGIEKSEISEAQSLKMARQALGRVKEMDLTPEQHKKVMAMIDEAKDAETVGNKSKALNIYLNLSEYLKSVNVFADKDKLKERQTEMVKNKINEISTSRIGNKKAYIEALEKQLVALERTEDEKYAVDKNEDYLIGSKFFTADQFMKIVCAAENIRPENLFVYNGMVNQKNEIVQLYIGIAADPSVVFVVYYHPFRFGESAYNIFRSQLDDKFRESNIKRSVAKWNASNKQWFGSKIDFGQAVPLELDFK